jgi:hypothetical protein|tara:strand:- start:105 stop:314 length:210 start_codon:yes stop_codon:yes gene_type:complete
LTDEEIRKDAYRVFWIVKGHFNTTEECILNCYNSYFKRVWYNEESYLYLDGFEEAYEKATHSKPKIKTD